MILLDPLARPVIGHRGASGSYPENTLLAFDRAVQLGVDALEMDLHITADGVPVVLHDPSVDRTTDGSGLIADLSAESVADLDAGLGERIPRFADVLEGFPSIPLIVEAKTGAAVDAIASAVLTAGARDRVLAGSFDNGAVRELRRHGLLTIGSRLEAAKVWTLAWVPGLSTRVSAVAFSVPEYSRRTHVVTARFVRAAVRRGCPVHVWTVDDPADAARLWTMGVSGIITNWPERIIPNR